jgi:hypothetical protein
MLNQNQFRYKYENFIDNIKTYEPFKNIHDTHEKNMNIYKDVLNNYSKKNLKDYIIKNIDKYDYILLCIGDILCDIYENEYLIELFKKLENIKINNYAFAYLLYKYSKNKTSKHIIDLIDFIIKNNDIDLNIVEKSISDWLTIIYGINKKWRYNQSLKYILDLLYLDNIKNYNTKIFIKTIFNVEFDIFKEFLSRKIKNNTKIIEKINSNCLLLLDNSTNNNINYMYFMFNTDIYNEKYILKCLCDKDYINFYKINKINDKIEKNNKIITITDEYNKNLLINIFDYKFKFFKKLTIKELVNILNKYNIYSQYLIECKIIKESDKFNSLITFLNYFSETPIDETNFYEFIFLYDIGNIIFNNYISEVLKSSELCDKIFMNALITSNINIIETLLNNKYELNKDLLLYCSEYSLSILAKYNYLLDEDSLIKYSRIHYDFNFDNIIKYSIYKDCELTELEDIKNKLKLNDLDNIIVNSSLSELINYLNEYKPKIDLESIIYCHNGLKRKILLDYYNKLIMI